MAEIFTGQASEFYKQVSILDVGPIPRPEMERFLTEQFSKGGMELDKSGADAIFLLAGDTPSDLQELSHHIWARSAPGVIGRQEIRDGFATVMHEYGRAGERVLLEATANQRRLLFALALRSTDADVFSDDFRVFANFESRQSVGRTAGAFTGGRTAILEKRGGKVLFRERFMRLWLVGQLMRNPGQFPAVKNYEGEWLELVKPFIAPDVFVRYTAPDTARMLQEPLETPEDRRSVTVTTATELIALLTPARDFYATTGAVLRREMVTKGLRFLDKLGSPGTTRIALRVAAKEYVEGVGTLDALEKRATEHFGASL
jgi:hypothetical protein